VRRKNLVNRGTLSFEESRSHIKIFPASKPRVRPVSGSKEAELNIGSKKSKTWPRSNRRW
jgi:hypothetical protein